MIHLNVIILLISPFFTLFLFGYVFGQRRNNRLNRAFLVLVGTFLVLTLFEFVLRLAPLQPIVQIRLLGITTALFFAATFAFFNFIYAFVKRDHDMMYHVFGALCLVAMLLPLLNVPLHGYQNDAITGSFMPVPNKLFFLLFIVYNIPTTIYAISLTIYAFLHSTDPLQKKMLSIWLWGLVVAFLYIVFVTFILPVLFGITATSTYGSLAIIIVDFFAYWAVRRHNFLTINIPQLEEILEKTFFGSNDAIFLLDARYKIVRANKSAHDLLKIPTPVPECFSLQAIIPEVAEGPVPDHSETELKLADGIHSVLVTKTNLNTADESISYMVALRDVTRANRIAKEERRAQQLETLGVLAGGIAHDFNNVLCGIVSALGYAKTGAEPDTEMFSVLNEAEHAAFRARSLTHQLLTFAKGGTPLFDNVNIVEVVREASVFALRGSKSKIDLELPDNEIHAQIDSGQIQQVLQNIVLNAAQSMPDGGLVRVSGKKVMIANNDKPPLKAGSCFEIRICDQGCGIPPENLSRIFEPYFTTKSGGTGLGLAVADTILKRHLGRCEVLSEAGNGTQFIVYLPLGEGKPRAIKREGTSTIADIKRVLIMDDDKVIRLTLGVLLKNLGYSVEEAASGEEALDKYKQSFGTNKTFKCIISDLTVPGKMGGKALAEAIRSFDPAVPIILSSGYSEEIEIQSYKKYGFTSVLLKPYSLDELRKALELKM